MRARIVNSNIPLLTSAWNLIRKNCEISVFRNVKRHRLNAIEPKRQIIHRLFGVPYSLDETS